jgi:hypothetical protein
MGTLQYELLEHPPYSSDLVPSDLYLFPKLKVHKSLWGLCTMNCCKSHPIPQIWLPLTYISFQNSKFIKVYGDSAVWIVGTSTLFPRFGSLWLIPLSKTQNLSRWSAFFFKLRDDCSCRRVFCISYDEPLQVRDNGAGASLE